MTSDAPLANVVTLGVSDIAGEREFYRRLGWPLVLDTEGFVVFDLRGAVLALFGLNALGRDAHAAPAPGNGGIRTSIIIIVDRPEDVDLLIDRARAAGARVTKEPEAPEFFEGRDAYFADPRATSGRSRGRLATIRSLPLLAARRDCNGWLLTGVTHRFDAASVHRCLLPLED